MTLSAATDADEPAHPMCRTCRWYSLLDVADKAFFDKRVVEDFTLGPLFRTCRESGLLVGRNAFRTRIARHHQPPRRYADRRLG
jgi:hypothetical protein